ncbi:hypothetical protein WA538_005344 [Blastocystis sp. DL]
MLTLLLAMGGYALKGFKQTFAVRQFSASLVGAVGDRFRGNKAVQRANQYLGGSTVLANAAKLADNEEVQTKSLEYFRRVFEATAVLNGEIAVLVQRVVLMFVNEGDAFEEFITRQTLNFCSFYVPYLGGRASHAGFLDMLFKVIMTLLLTQDCEEALQKRLLAVSAYVFDFNVVHKNISPYRVYSRERVASNIDQILGQTNLVTEAMLRSLRDKMTACSDETQSVDIMRDFFIELRTAFEGNGDVKAKESMMVDIPKTAAGKKNRKNRKNNQRTQMKGADNQRGKGKKGNKRRQYKSSNRDHKKIFGDDDDDLESMSNWQ